MIENVRGFLGAVFSGYRTRLREAFEDLGYKMSWQLLQASDFGVPQLRPRVVIVALREDVQRFFRWPLASGRLAPTVGETLIDVMAESRCRERCGRSDRNLPRHEGR